MRGTLFLAFCLIYSISLVSAADIAYVVQNPGNLNLNERVIRDVLIENNYEVEVIDNVSFNADDYEAVIVSESVSDIKNIFDNKNHKTLFLSNSAAENAGLSSGVGFSTGTRIYITNNQHMITEGLDLGDLQVYRSQTDVKYIQGCKAIGAESLAYKSDAKNSVLLLVEEDSLLLEGSCKGSLKINERNLFFGLTKSSEWNSDAEILFLNSLDWMINYNDGDGDGFVKKEDCNDEDASIHPNARELIDNIDQNCVNDKPVFIGKISDVNWKVNQRIINAINLKDYFKDPEGDDLVFKINEISAQEIYAIIDNGLVSFESLQDWKGEGWIIFKAENDAGSAVSNKVILKVGEQNTNVNETGSSTPEFDEITGRKETNKSINVYIRSPAEGRIIDIGDKTSIRIEIRNDAGEDLEFDVDVYLYDLTDNEIVEDLSYTIDVDDGERIISDKEIEIFEDLDEDDKYAIFAKASDREYYNEDYALVDLVRAEDKVVIDGFNISPKSVSCGDYVDVNIGVYNTGKNDENVYIKIKNSDLKISEESEKFDLEKYGEDDNENKEFRFKIPENVEQGDYAVTATVFFNGRSFSLDDKITVNCSYNKETSSDISSGNPENLEPVRVAKDDDFNFGLLFLVLGILTFGVFVSILLVIGYFRFRGR